MITRKNRFTPEPQMRHISQNYRESYGMFVGMDSSLIMRRNLRHAQDDRAEARTNLGMQECLYLGNLEVKYAWGFDGDYATDAAAGRIRWLRDRHWGDPESSYFARRGYGVDNAWHGAQRHILCP